MKEEIKIWLNQAIKDLSTAKISLNSNEYEWASFQAHQSVEKGLKYLNLKKNGTLIKTHDLVLLARKTDAPKNIIEICSKINPSYVDTRYPDVPKKYEKSDAEEIIKSAEEVIEWIKKN